MFVKLRKKNEISDEYIENLDILYQKLCDNLARYNEYVKSFPSTEKGKIYHESYKQRLNHLLSFYIDK